MTIKEIREQPRKAKIRFLSKNITIQDPASGSIARRLMPQKWWNQYSDKEIDSVCSDYAEAFKDFLEYPEPQMWYITVDPVTAGDNIIKMKARRKSEVEDYCNRNGIKFYAVVPKKGHHICKYCGGNIVEGSYEDLLCAACRELFGHSLYSEL